MGGRTPWPESWSAAILPLVTLAAVRADGAVGTVVREVLRTNLVGDGGRVLGCVQHLLDSGAITESADGRLALTADGARRLDDEESLWPSFARLVERGIA